MCIIHFYIGGRRCERWAFPAFEWKFFSERLHTYGDDDESHVDYVFQNGFPLFFFLNVTRPLYFTQKIESFTDGRG